MDADPQLWLINWFVKNVGLSSEEIATKTKENYFGLGWIDSLKFITFILEIEQEFKIHFSNEEFQDRDFATLEGLSRFISKKRLT